MRYILAEKTKAEEAGFLILIHRSNKKYVLLNENEVRHSDRLSGTLEERAAALGGEPLTEKETFKKIKNKGKYRIV